MTDFINIDELNVKQYVSSLGLNPENVYYQRISCTNISTTMAQWAIVSPNKRALLLACPKIEWKPTVRRVRVDTGAAEDFVESGLAASWKEYMPFHNAMSSLQLIINSSSITITQPRRYQRKLNEMFFGRKAARSELSTCGGAPHINSGYILPGVPGVFGSLGPNNNDLFKNEQRFMEKLWSVAGAAGNVFRLQGRGNSFQISCLEPLCVGPFNPYYRIKHELPDYCWFKHMSFMIPHVSRMEINIQFQNIDPSIILSRYIRAAAAGRHGALNVTGLAADLLLYWYNPPIDMIYDRQISLQTWYVREFITSVNANAAVTNNNNAGAAAPDTISINSELFQLNNVPSLIVIHAEVDKDSTTYTYGNLSSDTDQAGANIAHNLNANALDSDMEIQNLQIILGDRPQVLSTTFSQRELYDLLLKNSNHKDFPYSYEQWKGGLLPRPEANGANAIGDLYTIQSRCMVAFQPYDLSERFGSGFQFPTSIQFSCNLVARDGFHGQIYGGNKIYKLFTHCFYGKHFLTLTPEAGQYTEESININQIVKPIVTKEYVKTEIVQNVPAMSVGGGYRRRSGY